MKVRLAEVLQLIVTPENYVEHVALAKWAETHQGAGGLLVESYAEHCVQADEVLGCTSCRSGLCPDGKGGYVPCTICGNTVQPKSALRS